MLASPIYPRWIEGFEPKRCDMVFDRQRPSCYASAEFRDMADDIGGNYVVAGQFGELSCLSTAIDALHRDHRPTFLTDALVSLSYEDTSASAVLKALARILSLYAEVVRTEPWIIATSQRVGART
jgi:isochorismate hydrolase